ncbi:MAG: peptidylprolyl isomerase [Thermodesulfobacteriota bacterium]
MSQATKGSKVLVQYTGKFEDGTVFDTSVGREPLEFIVGEGKVIPGVESMVEGMSSGEEKTETVPAELAYGARHEELIMEVPKERIPDNIKAEVGTMMQITMEGGQTAVVKVEEVTDSIVKLDANHPLAGKDLTFDIKVITVD